MSYPNVLIWAVPGFLLALAAELWWARRQARQWFVARDTAASLGMGIGSLVFGGLGGGVVVAVHLALYSNRLLDLPTATWMIPLCFVLQDLCFYWKHRFQHERRWLWAEHVNHHSSEQYNLSTALRQGWTGFFALNWLFYLPLSLIGFHPAMIFGCSSKLGSG